MKENLQMITLRALQLTAVARAIAELDERNVLFYGDNIDALEVAINLAYLLEEDGKALLRDVSDSESTCYASVHEAVTAAKALADLAEKVTWDDAKSLTSFFSMAYVTERTMKCALEALQTEAWGRETA